MLRYGSAHTIRIGENIVVPEAQHAIAIRFDDGGSIGIDPFVMLPAIGLDYQLVAVRREIDPVLADIYLSPETGVREAGPQQIP